MARNRPRAAAEDFDPDHLILLADFIEQNNIPWEAYICAVLQGGAPAPAVFSDRLYLDYTAALSWRARLVRDGSRARDRLQRGAGAAEKASADAA